jgi:hypothetical protein
MADADKRPRKERPLSALERQLAQALGDGREFGHPEDPARMEFPLLWEWLSRAYVGREHLKQPAVILLRLGPDGALATLSDRDLACSLDVGSQSLLDLFRALETALARPDCPIKVWGKKEPQLKKRKSGN